MIIHRLNESHFWIGLVFFRIELLSVDLHNETNNLIIETIGNLQLHANNVLEYSIETCVRIWTDLNQVHPIEIHLRQFETFYVEYRMDVLKP